MWFNTDLTVKFATVLTLASGAQVSAAVCRQDGEVTLRFKRRAALWPPDAEAVVIGTLEQVRPVFLLEKNGDLILGDGFGLLLRCRGAGLEPQDWEEL